MKYKCPVVERGVRLRGLCVGCEGTPSGLVALERGEVLFRQGDPATRVFAVTEGWLRVFVTTADGKACAARLVGPGHVLGLESFGRGGTSGQPSYHATVDALRPAKLCAVPLVQVKSWFRQNPDEALALTAMTVEDMAELQRRLVHNASLSAEERVFELVKDLADHAPLGTWVQLPATREQLGEVLGLTFETVSRMIHRLVDRGVLEVEGRRVRMLATSMAAAAPA